MLLVHIENWRANNVLQKLKKKFEKLWLPKMRKRLTKCSPAVLTICQLWAPRWSGSSRAPPSRTCSWSGTPWWSGSTPRSRWALKGYQMYHYSLLIGSGVLQGKARPWVPGCGHEMGGQVTCLWLVRLGPFFVNITRDEMTNEHATTALCMNELRGCQKFSMGPNFIYFGTQKYGYRLVIRVKKSFHCHRPVQTYTIWNSHWGTWKASRGSGGNEQWHKSLEEMVQEGYK